MTVALIGGQVLHSQCGSKPLTVPQLEEIHRAKTGALIRCAVRVGAIIGGASEDELNAITEYGEKAGLAFQVADDLLDETATSEELGKTAGKDAASQKAPTPRLTESTAPDRWLIASAAKPTARPDGRI